MKFFVLLTMMFSMLFAFGCHHYGNHYERNVVVHRDGHKPPPPKHRNPPRHTTTTTRVVHYR